jgi:hypothetical protein
MARFVALLALLSVVMSGPAAAQERVVLSGRVLSDTQEPVRSATVTVRTATGTTPERLQERLQQSTDAAGAFSIVVSAAGEYLVDVNATGFFPLTARTVTIASGAVASGTGAGATTGTGAATELIFTLEPIREYSETTNVQARSDALVLERNAADQTIGSQELLNVPYPGSENVKNSLRILPGVVQDAFTGIHLNGAPEHEVLFLLDGFNIGDPLTGRYNPRISVDAVRAINVMSGPIAAEFGKGSAGAIEIVTNTGGDRMRYSAATFVPVIGNQKGWRVLDWTPRVSVSGPIKAGRAWFTNNANGEFHQYVVPELPRGDDQTWRARVSDHLHAQINPTSTNMLHASALVSMAWGRNSGLSALDPVSTTLDSRSRQVMFNLRDQQMLAGGALFEVGYGSNRTFLRQEPKGRAPYLFSPEGREGNHYFDGRQTSSRDQVLANLYLPAFTLAGAHQIKTGVGVDRLGYDQEIGRTEIRLFDAELTPIRTIAFEGSGRLSASNVEFGAYVQDTWRLSSRVVAQLGVRADWDDLVSTWGASPRVGIAWSPFGDDDTRISGGYAIARDATRLNLFSRADDQQPINTFFLTRVSSSGGIPPPGGQPPQPRPLPQSFRSTFVIPDRLASPHARTWSLTVDRRLPANLVVRAQAFDRRSTNGLSFFGTPSSDSDTTYTLSNERTERYRSVEASVRQTIRQEYGWSASYTRSRVTSNAVIDIGPGDYVLATHNDGPLDWDVPHRLVAWFYLPTVIRPKWAIAGLVDYRSGFPFSALDDAGFVVGSANAYRYPSHFELDLAIERRITLRRHLWALRVGVDNITGHFNPTSVNANITSDRFGQFYGGQDRLLIARLRWLGRSR